MREIETDRVREGEIVRERGRKRERERERETERNGPRKWRQKPMGCLECTKPFSLRSFRGSSFVKNAAGI